jgi:predicted nucleic acid-binding protein
MGNKIRTFVDASVLIYAAKKPSAETFVRRSRALLLLSDPDREFVASEFLKMEVMPFALHYDKKGEVKFYETFFQAVEKWADCSILLAPAYEISRVYAVGVIDALHIAAAAQLGAEFVSAEKPTKPIYRAYQNITSIY